MNEKQTILLVKAASTLHLSARSSAETEKKYWREPSQWRKKCEKYEKQMRKIRWKDAYEAW